MARVEETRLTGGFGPRTHKAVETAPTTAVPAGVTTGGTHGAARIAKLLARGLPCATIARKIGSPGKLKRIHRVGCNCPVEKAEAAAASPAPRPVAEAIPTVDLGAGRVEAPGVE